jgi:hypothetical protein
MKKQRVLGGVLILLFLAPILLMAASTAPPLAFGVPRSDRLVRGDIVISGGNLVAFTAREGTIVSIQDASGRAAAGLSPAITGDSEVSFLVLEMKGPDLGDVGNFGDVATLQVGTSTPVDTPLGAAVLSVGDVVTAEFPRLAESSGTSLRPSELRHRFGRSGGGTCCVTCGGLTACGSGIRASCGACEMGPVKIDE